MRNKILLTILILIFPSITVINAYDTDNVHPLLNENALFQSNVDNYLKTQLGFANGIKEVFKTKRITEWIKDGAKLEDETVCRSRNHFHDPLKSWDSAGLSNPVVDSYCLLFGYEKFSADSSLIWAQKQSINFWYDSLWSWPKARNYYYKALTTTTKDDREKHFAYAFRALGQITHLIADSSVPAHVRNDIHVFPLSKFGISVGSPTYESWARDNYRTLPYTGMQIDQSIFLQAVNNALAPAPISALWDQDKYTGTNPNVTAGSIIGIAEYTNANFFSEDTIFADQPYPAWSSVTEYDEEIAIGKLRTNLRKTGDGETVTHLAAGKWFYKYLPSNKKSLGLKLDDVVYADYAQKLIPRAVGYSAGLLDYFFRVNIEITRPDSGIYAQTTPDQGFSRVTLLAKNTTSTGEEMTDGSIELVVKYKLAIDDPFRNYPPDYSFRAAPEFSYIVAPEANGIRSIPRGNPVELTFNLGNSIPLWAIDVYLQVVYKGRLGNEDGAVVVGLKDISEPTPIDIFNDMDRICLKRNFYVAGSSGAITAVDTDETIGNNNGIADEWDIYPHDLKDIYGRISPVDAPRYASPANYNLLVPYLNAGHYVRALYVLADDTFNNNFYQTWVKKDPGDAWAHGSSVTDIFFGKAVKNQTDYVEDPNICAPMVAPCTIWWYPTFLSYRGTETWWGSGIMYINNAYPLNSECSCYEGILRTCPIQQLSRSESGGLGTLSAQDNVHVDDAGRTYLRRLQNTLGISGVGALQP
jgi:hypothetical protein